MIGACDTISTHVPYKASLMSIEYMPSGFERSNFDHMIDAAKFGPRWSTSTPVCYPRPDDFAHPRSCITPTLR